MSEGRDRENATFKKIALLTPRSDFTLARFSDYWQHIHGPVVANAPNYAAYRRRYVQNHVIEQGPVGGPVGYAGMAEFWLSEPNENEYAATSTYLDHIRPDEQNFIDMDRTLSVTAREFRLAEGSGKTKLVIFHQRKPGMTSGEFAAGCMEWAQTAANGRSAASGLSINLIEEGSTVSPGARSARALPIDCMISSWFGSVRECKEALRSRESRQRLIIEDVSYIAPDQTKSFMVRELVFFDDGAPTALAAGKDG